MHTVDQLFRKLRLAQDSVHNATGSGRCRKLNEFAKIQEEIDTAIVEEFGTTFILIRMEKPDHIIGERAEASFRKLDSFFPVESAVAPF